MWGYSRGVEVVWEAGLLVWSGYRRDALLEKKFKVVVVADNVVSVVPAAKKCEFETRLVGRSTQQVK